MRTLKTALEQAGMASPEIEFEYVRGDAAGNRARFVFLGEGESAYVSEALHMVGPAIVLRRTGPTLTREICDHFHCDDPDAINLLVRWIERVAAGEARLVVGSQSMDSQKLALFRRARTEWIYHDDDLRSM